MAFTSGSSTLDTRKPRTFLPAACLAACCMLSISSFPNFPMPKPPPLRERQCWNVLDLLSELQFGLMQIVSLLHIEPETGTISAQLPDTQRHARTNRLLFLQDVIK